MGSLVEVWLLHAAPRLAELHPTELLHGNDGARAYMSAQCALVS